MSVLVSVVVPTYRRPELLERCLASLAVQDFGGERFEIVIADDGDEDRIRELAERWSRLTDGAPAIRYVPVRATQGPAGARNAGAREASGEVIAFTDDDTIAHPDWLAAGWIAMRSGAAAAAGRVRVPLPDSAPTDYERDMSRLATAQFVTASCFVRRDVLEAIGGFDERFTSAWREDSDLQFRLLGAQGGVVDASWAVVEHPVRPAKWAASLSRHRKILFDALLFKKHPRLYRERIRSTAPWHYHAIVIALAAIAAGALLRSPALAWTGFGVWLALTAEFALKRLHGTSHAPAHVAEMVVTSIAIPPLAVFWRLVGAFRFRVFFL